MSEYHWTDVADDGRENEDANHVIEDDKDKLGFDFWRGRLADCR